MGKGNDYLGNVYQVFKLEKKSLYEKKKRTKLEKSISAVGIIVLYTKHPYKYIWSLILTSDINTKCNGVFRLV